jgi:hypothetical protein
MRYTLSLCGLAVLAGAAAADEPAVRPAPFVLRPAAAPSPALKYTLLPDVRDMAPGNAAERYRKAIQIMKQDGAPAREWYPRLDQWMQEPMKDLARDDEARAFLKTFETTFKELDAAARCESCDWGLTEKVRAQGITTLLPDVQHCREFAALLQLKIRMAAAEGRFDDAVHSLQTGYALSRHVADAPSLICALVGMAITNIMTPRLEEVLQQPGAPNLYWALTDLPQPFIDLRKPMQGERLMAYGTFPGMAGCAADPNAGPWDEKQVGVAVERLRQLGDEQNDMLRLRDQALLALRLAQRHEAAKQQLIAQGRPKEKVDAMPHVQVGLLVAFQQYEQRIDEVVKCQNLPAWESRPRLEEADRRRAELADQKDGPAVPIAKLLSPAFRKIFNARVRTDRRLAALRCVEAVRLYAAGHDGKFPSALSEIKEVPIPMDPYTGKDFLYTAERDRAVLSSTPTTGEPPASYNTPAYELLPKN